MGVRKLKKSSTNYPAIESIDGQHPFKEKVPGAYVDYEARIRPGSKPTFFNFNLAKEMGLISKNHPHELNPALNEILCETFGIIIINEWDYSHNKHYKASEKKLNRFMATRYLQLQHPDKIGLSSGDGRSVWNGTFKSPNGQIWDISSCGTGATCLSPASVINNKFYRSGDKEISYGCGYSELSEGVMDVLFSEAFYRNKIPTERVLCVIEFPGNYCVTVRAGLNLLRPSHFFNHLRQGQLTRLHNAIDFFIDRQIHNKTWKKPPKHKNRYDYMAEHIAETFATITALYESEYIFCWLDWDGDNILADGSIVDFGSVRQFGLYHHSYRFDDDNRWSTNLKEQKSKAKHIVQTFLQIADYIKKGQKRPLSTFKSHPIIKRFDKIFADKKRYFFLKRIGLTEKWVQKLQAKNPKFIKDLETAFYYFESRYCQEGPVEVPDGIMYNAIYSMRDLLRQLPQSYQESSQQISPQHFLQIMRSTYASEQALEVTSYRRQQIHRFQKSYWQMIHWLSRTFKLKPNTVLTKINARSQILNRYERITGDALCIIGERITNARKKLSSQEFHQLVEDFLKQQSLQPESNNLETPHCDQQIKRFMQVIRSHRQGI